MLSNPCWRGSEARCDGVVTVVDKVGWAYSEWFPFLVVDKRPAAKAPYDMIDVGVNRADFDDAIGFRPGGRTSFKCVKAPHPRRSLTWKRFQPSSACPVQWQS